jgi:serine/threonine protein kinase
VQVHIIDSYAFCAARAENKQLLAGYEWLPCIMLEWAEEGSLWEEVKPPNGPPAPLGVSRCRLVLSQLLFAVRAVHEAGYVHRDIKPHNILKARSGRSTIYKLCDFGTALSDSQLPANEGEEGTPAYIPPEKYWQASSDTWQIGKCLLALRSGAAPHTGTFEEVRDSGQYNSLEQPMVEAEWGFLKKVPAGVFRQQALPAHAAAVWGVSTRHVRAVGSSCESCLWCRVLQLHE